MKKIVYLVKDSNYYITETEKYTWNDMIDMIYGYTFLFDPLILAYTKSIPEMKTLKEISDWESIDLFISCLGIGLIEEYMEKPLLDGVKKILERNKTVIFTQPPRIFYNTLPQLKNKTYIRDIISMCETFDINTPLCKHTQSYPQNICFQAVKYSGEIYSTIGEWPALFIDNNFCFFTVDLMVGFDKRYIYKHADLWVFLVNKLLWNKNKDIDCSKEIGLRRDFHAFGYCLLMLKELAKLEKKNIYEYLTSACKSVINAATEFVNGSYVHSQEKLKVAFNILYNARLTITKMDIYLMDIMHASTLYDDASFAEMESPQLLTEFFDLFFKLINERNFKLLLDWDVRSIESLSKRTPILIEKMKKYLAAGKLEFINGGYVQHYPHYWSVQSSIQILKYGQKIFREIFGDSVISFGGQECCVNPQIPNIIKKTGYKYVLHRIQNFGHVPLVKYDYIQWRGKDGSIIDAIPGNPSATERLGSIFYLMLAYKIHKSIKDGLEKPVFTTMQDVGVISFREEIVRIAFYAPIFGRFTTIKEYFSNIKNKGTIISFDYYDYVHGYFYNSIPYRGNENDSFIKAFALEHTILDGQLLNGIAVYKDASSRKDFRKHLDVLSGLQAHDALIATNIFTGGFFNAKGPLNINMTYHIKTRMNYNDVLNDAKRNIKKDLKAVIGKSGKHTVVFNTLGFNRNVLVKDTKGVYGHVNLPSYGYSTSMEYNCDNVRVTETSIENEYIIAIFNRDNGSIQIIDKNSGKPVIKRYNEFVFGNNSRMKVEKFDIIKNNNIKPEVKMKGVILSKNKIISWYETSVSISSKSRVLDTKTRFYPVISIPSNPCDNAIRLSICFYDNNPEIITSYLNVSEKMKYNEINEKFFNFIPKTCCIFYTPSDKSLKMFSSLYYTRIKTKNGIADIYNNGQQYYYYKKDTIFQHLIGHNDSCYEFNYAVAINNIEMHPLSSSLDWQIPVLVSSADKSKKWSLFNCNRNNILLFGCEIVDDSSFILRMMEIEGKETEVIVNCGFPVKEIYESDYFGNKLKDVKQIDKSFCCELPKWGISEFIVKITCPVYI